MYYNQGSDNQGSVIRELDFDRKIASLGLGLGLGVDRSWLECLWARHLKPELHPGCRD